MKPTKQRYNLKQRFKTRSTRLTFGALAAILSVGLITQSLVPMAYELLNNRTQAAPTANIPQDYPTASGTQIGGLIFRDFNANGTIDTQEPGYTSIGNTDPLTVTAYD